MCVWNSHLWFRVEGLFVARRSIVTLLIVGRIVCMCGYLKLVLGSYSSLVLFLVLTGLGCCYGVCRVLVCGGDVR